MQIKYHKFKINIQSTFKQILKISQFNSLPKIRILILGCGSGWEIFRCPLKKNENEENSVLLWLDNLFPDKNCDFYSTYTMEVENKNFMWMRCVQFDGYSLRYSDTCTRLCNSLSPQK